MISPIGIASCDAIHHLYNTPVLTVYNQYPVFWKPSYFLRYNNVQSLGVIDEAKSAFRELSLSHYSKCVYCLLLLLSLLQKHYFDVISGSVLHPAPISSRSCGIILVSPYGLGGLLFSLPDLLRPCLKLISIGDRVNLFYKSCLQKKNELDNAKII